MIENNNELQPKLNSENAKFYDDLLIYVRASGIFRDEHVIENQLLEILNDLIDAQKDGIRAQDYFGNNAKAVADGIIKEVPFNTFDLFKAWGTGLLSYIFMCSLSGINLPKIPIDLGSVLISGIYFSIIAMIIMKALGYTVYRVHNASSKIVNILYFLLICALIAPGYLALILLKTPLRFKIDNGFGIIIIGLIMIESIYVLLKVKDKSFVIPFFVYIWIICIMGILNRLPVIGTFLNHSKAGAFTNVGAIIITLLAFVLVFRNNTKKN